MFNGFVKRRRQNLTRIVFPHGYTAKVLILMTKVDYFLQKRLTDKRKELMYAQGVAVAPDRGVGQLGSR
jgi:hypothetical protein